jgi:hypothetical protein
MADEGTYGREPVQIIEIKQPRCGLRFGALPCRAAVADAVLRTNIALFSEQLDNAYWTKTRGTVTANAAVAPDGLTTADKFVENTATGIHEVSRSLSFTNATSYTFSVYVKAAEITTLRLVLTGSAFTAVVISCNLSTGAMTTLSGAPDAVGSEALPGGWWRFWFRELSTATNTATVAYRLDKAGSGSYAGDGTSGVLLWGAQVEVGLEPSTYKRTTDAPVGRLWGTGTQPCYNTYWTCQDRENYAATGSIAWRFTSPRAGVLPLYDESGNDIKANPLYSLAGVTTSPSRINIGARRSGESPLGILSSCTATFKDEPFDDHVGDYYLSQRPFIGGNFWAKTIARNPFQPEWEMRLYEGYRGQALGDMQVRFYPVENIEGPDAGGTVTVRGADPLQRADRRKSQFPRATDIKLADPINDSVTTAKVVSSVADLSADFGNTGSRRYIRIGSEIMEYTGWTGTAPDLTLTGMTRGALGTAAASHAVDDAAQRVGRYERVRQYRIAKDLIENHTVIGSGYIDNAQWEDEGGKFLPLFTATATIPSPEDTEKLIGELCRDGLFSIWWDERLATIPLLAVRPPQETPVVLTDDLNILKSSSEIKAVSEDRLTRVTVFYKQINPLTSTTDPTNYTRRDINISGEYELPQSTGGEIRELTIYSRWIRTEAQALLVAAQLLLRYRNVPRYLSVKLDAKDRSIRIGDVADITTGTVTDVNGRPQSTRWQVISYHEIKAGDTVMIDLQSYLFFGRFTYWMDNATPSYASASDAQRARGFFWADENGKMPDGTDGYQWQ